MLPLVLVSFFALTPAQSEIESDDGTVHLVWSDGEAEAYDVEHRFDGAEVVFRSGVTDFHLSGLRAGKHRYRLREAGSEEWSAPIIVLVRFPARAMVVTLLLVGTLMLAATAFVILRGPGEGS